MPRPPLLIGTWGKIRRKTIEGRPTAIAHYRDSTGRTLKMQREGRTEPEAERNLLAALKAKLDDESSDLLSADSTIADLADKWLEELKLKAPPAGTVTTYRGAIERSIKPKIGALRLSEATVPRLDRFVKGMLVTPSSAKTARTVLRQMFALAVRHGAVRRNPVSDTMPVTTKRKPVRVITLDGIHQMRGLFQTHDKTRTSELWELSGLLMATGCRIGEALALHWDDVDLQTGVLHVTSTLVTGEDGKLHRQEHPKSDAGDRGITLPPTIVQLLAGRRVGAHYPMLFPSSTGTYRWPANSRRQWRDAIAESLYVGKTPRDFRRAVATHLDREVGIEAARDQLGHGDEEVTVRYYVERQKAVADFAAVIERMFAVPS